MKFKRFLLPIFLLTMVFAVMAFTLPRKSNVKTTTSTTKTVRLDYHFRYIGPSPAASFSDYTNPANYVFVPEDQNPYELCEEGHEAVCFISCEGAYYLGFFRPDFSNTSWGSAYSGLYHFYNYGYTPTTSVWLRPME